ncbi:MAG TPA: gamma-glutamyl-gamma-aminobutyrate hydrolase family protein [Nitrososphaerales archaeon]|nr:gamma-glutamyl-gamma-aminobutyrate hydrolase family protein [Nitrososphaerales archaeon]
MPKVLVVNNYPTRERVVRLEKCLEGNGATVNSAEWGAVSASKFNSFDGVVLSGSPDMMTEAKTKEKFAEEVQAVRDAAAPVLGVCFGHQLMAHAFGAQVVKDRQHVLRMVKTTVLNGDSLFEGLPDSLMLLESRHEVVKSLPKGFHLLAKSATSAIAAMRHTNRPLFGVQFHPERYTIENPDGNRVAGNFVGLLK